MEAFEKQRFLLLKYPHYQISEEYERDNMDKEMKTEVLIISMAGSTLIIGGFPRPDFQRTLIASCQQSNNAGHFQADLLFVTDPFQSFYLKNPSGHWDGGAFYAQRLQAFAEQYQKVIVIGSSMGATGILHLAGRFACHMAIVFNPLVDLRRDSRWMFWLGGQRIPKHLRDKLPSVITEQFQPPSLCQLLRVHVSQRSKADQEQRYILEGLLSGSSALHVEEHNSEEHVLPRVLAGSGQLTPLLSRALQDLLAIDLAASKKAAS